MSIILWSFGIWNKLETLKSLISECFISWPQIKKKNQHFEVSSSLFCSMMNLFSVGLWHVMKSGQQWAMTNLDQEAQKHFPEPNLDQKMSWSLFGSLLLVWSNTTFWIPVKPLRLRIMLSKLMRCTKNSNAYSHHW